MVNVTPRRREWGETMASVNFQNQEFNIFSKPQGAVLRLGDRGRGGANGNFLAALDNTKKEVVGERRPLIIPTSIPK